MVASTKVRYEQRNLLNDIETYMTTAGWSGITYKDTYQSDKTIVNPQVSLTFLPSRGKALQLGKVLGKDKLFTRIVQLDTYMENDIRSGAIVDDLMDFFLEDMCVFILDPAGNNIGYISLTTDDSVYGEVVPPLMSAPKLTRYRGIVRATVESFYPGD